MLKPRICLLASTALTLASGAALSPALAQEQEAEAAMIEEIIVTGRKRGAELLQDIPATISALSENTLERMNVDDFVDFAYQIPGLTFNDQGPGEKRYIIRGIQSAGQQQVAVYYDEMPLPGVQSSTSDSGSQTTDLKIFDMQRVEVLKGPQGTTFGANSQIGTIRFITNKPVMNEVEATLKGEFNKIEHGNEGGNVYAMINFPLAEDKLALRTVAYYDREPGFIDNVRLGFNNINFTETIGFRTLLRFQPTENITLDGVVWIQDRDNGGDVRFHPFDSFSQDSNPNGIGDLDNVSAQALFQTGDLDVGDYTFTGKPDLQEIYGLTLNWDFDWAALTATGSYYKRDFEFKFDSSWILFFLGVGPAGATCPSGDPCVRPDLFPAQTDQRQDLEQKAFELRFNSQGDSRFQWLAGAFYRERDSDFRSFVPVVDPVTGRTFDPGTPFTGPSTAVGAGIPDCHPCVFARQNTKQIDEIAFFGEVTFDLTEKIELLGGLRWFEAEQNDLGRTVFPFVLFSSGMLPPPDERFFKEDRLIKKGQISFFPTDDIILFALASQGFRLGGTNQQGVVAVPPGFEADSLWNYEVGLKSSWFDRRLIFNANAFFIEWDNIQVSGQDPTGAFGFIGNAGAAEVIGIELDIQAVPTPALELWGGLAWLPKAELTKDQISDEVVAPGRAGDQLPRIPELTLNAMAQYNFSLPVDGWESWIRGEFNFRGSSETELRPTSPNNRPQRSFEIFNFRFGALDVDTNLLVSAYVENVFDTRGDVFIGVGNGEPTFKITNQPRTFGLELTKRF